MSASVSFMLYPLYEVTKTPQPIAAYQHCFVKKNDVVITQEPERPSLYTLEFSILKHQTAYVGTAESFQHAECVFTTASLSQLKGRTAVRATLDASTLIR